MVVVTLHDVHGGWRYLIGQQWTSLLEVTRQMVLDALRGRLLKSC